MTGGDPSLYAAPWTRHHRVRRRASVVGAATPPSQPAARARVRSENVMPHVVASSSLPSAVTTRGRTPASSSRVVLPGHRGTTARARAVAGPRIIVDGGAESAMRGLSEKRREVIEDMGSFAGGELMGLLKDPDTNWQPQDWLPDPSRDDFLDQVRGDDATRRDATRLNARETRSEEDAYPSRLGARGREREGVRVWYANGRVVRRPRSGVFTEETRG